MVMVQTVTSSITLAAEPIPATQLEFFESRIRPVLVKHCYECHGGDSAEGELRLDSRAAFQKGGESGPVVDGKTPNKSLILKLIRHEIEDREMPQGSPKLSDEIIRDFEKWIAMGTPDPRDHPPSAEELAAANSWEAIREKRKQWWSFQPITKPTVPAAIDGNASQHPVDRFIAQRLQEQGLTPSPQADPRTLIRRLSFTLIGLPPSADDIDKFVNDPSNETYQQLVDQYLASPHFGEQWARHWMDWVRYAETHGSEGDPGIPYAYQYRDYMIRALNNDVPYDQLLKEQIAGDLIDNPRINHETGINESTIGPAQWRFVYHGFAPTDALAEKVRFTDDQVNVFSKAFLGLTVSCARCHNHKFDPISQADYYALYGILASTHPAIVDANTGEKRFQNVAELTAIKSKLRADLADDLRQSTSKIADKLTHLDSGFQQRINEGKAFDALFDWFKRIHAGEDPKAVTAAAEADYNQRLAKRTARNQNSSKRWKLPSHAWTTTGVANERMTPDSLLPAADWIIAPTGNLIFEQFLPSGIYSHALSNQHAAMVVSPRFHLDGEYDLWIHVLGQSNATVRYAVQDYPRSGTVYPITKINSDWRWQKYDLKYWDGDDIHIELATAPDQPLQAEGTPRSWFGVREAVLVPRGVAFDTNTSRFFDAIIQDHDLDKIESTESLAKAFQTSAEHALFQWRQGIATNEQLLFLDALRQTGLLNHNIDQFPESTQKLLAQYRELEAKIPTPTRVPGILEADSHDAPLFARGDHHKPGDPVPRRFLEAIDATPYEPSNSGRLQLANDLLRDDNPLTRRVIVNRMWHHLFGHGIVRTPDNFGWMGDEPTHPALLDYLATEFVREQWSMKKTIRRIVTSQTWKQQSAPSAIAQQSDPDNLLLSHAFLQRLTAEQIRDHLLTISGRLDQTLFGPPQNGTGHNRRSIYTSVRRNNIDPFLLTFDTPVPASTVGKRSVTNVPAQSLTMLNSPFVDSIANGFGKKFRGLESGERVTTMFKAALGREPTSKEKQRCMEYLRGSTQQAHLRQQQRNELSKQQAELIKKRSSLIDPILQKLSSDDSPRPPGPEPSAHWTFDNDFQDSIGNLHGTARGEVRIENGALLLNGKGFLSTPVLPLETKEKTLEVRVQLENLDQRSGGAMTLQTTDGTYFDSIVFAEATPRHWMSGSNNFQRTLPLNGTPEAEADKTPVHLVWVYRADGTILAYRNGTPYGKPIRKSDLRTYQANSSQLIFGMRHGTNVAGGRMLIGKIFDAKFYQRALTEEEVQAASSASGNTITQNMIVKAMTEDQRQSFADLEAKRDAVQKQIDSLGPDRNAEQHWNDLAHAILNLKELIYLR